jgi:hypothetical protein
LVSLIVFTIFGFFYDENHIDQKHGNQKTIAIVIFAFTGIFNGYYSAKYYKYMGGKHLAINLISSACLFPVNSIKLYKNTINLILNIFLL